MKTTGVYAITSILDKKMYIGCSVDIRRRWDRHKFYLRRNLHKNRYLQDAWNLYGENLFSFNIIEILPHNSTKPELTNIESKWIMHFRSDLVEFGYNISLPERRSKKDDDRNLYKSVPKVEYVCINIASGEIIFLLGGKVVYETIKISPAKAEDLSSYWKGASRRKSLHGWMIVKKEEYDPSFDYINYKKEKSSVYKYGKKLSPAEYYSIRKSLDPLYRQKRKPERIPYEMRNLKRVPIIAHNILTGEERTFPTIKSCYPEFSIMKIYKCITNEFGKYKHRGHYFRKI